MSDQLASYLPLTPAHGRADRLNSSDPPLLEQASGHRTAGAAGGHGPFGTKLGDSIVAFALPKSGP